MNEKKIYTEQEAKEYAESVSNTLYIRTYNNGNSDDTKRQTTESEKGILTNLIYGALLAASWHGLEENAVQGAKNTAEFIARLMIPNINGYLSVYLQIAEFIARYQ